MKRFLIILGYFGLFKRLSALTQASVCVCESVCWGGVKSYTIVSDIQNAAGDIICRKNNRATGYLEEKQ